jgi:predicted transcriptional regulator
MPNNADRFLNIFNAIERHLQIKYNNGAFAPFRSILKTAAAKDMVFRRYQDELFVLGDLRNVLVHNDRFDGRTIAEPLPHIVDEFEEIWKLVQNPDRVSVFEREVMYCFWEDKLEKALQIMKKHKILQIPIIEKGVIKEVLTGNHIASWLAGQESVVLSEVKISEVLLKAEYRNNFTVIPRSMSVYEAAEISKNSFKLEPKNRYYDALIITKNGKPNEKMTGIVVMKDIAAYILD